MKVLAIEYTDGREVEFTLVDDVQYRNNEGEWQFVEDGVLTVVLAKGTFRTFHLEETPWR